MTDRETEFIKELKVLMDKYGIKIVWKWDSDEKDVGLNLNRYFQGSDIFLCISEDL